MLLLNRFIESDGDVVNFTVKVGIGTTQPTRELDVIGNASISGNTSITGTSTVSGNATFTGSVLAKSAPEVSLPASTNIKINDVLFSTIIEMCAPTGSIIQYAGMIAPPGYLECNGAQVSRSQYATLFNVIGTIWGEGDRSTTFNLPSLGDRFLRHVGAKAGAVGTRMNDTLKLHTHSASMGGAGGHDHGKKTGGGGNHSHSLSDRTAAIATIGNENPAGTSSSTSRKGWSTGSVGDHTHSINYVSDHTHLLTIIATGGEETRPMFATVLFCIKT